MSFLLLKRTVFHSCQIKRKNKRKFTIESAKLSCAQWRTRHVAAPATGEALPSCICPVDVPVDLMRDSQMPLHPWNQWHFQ